MQQLPFLFGKLTCLPIGFLRSGSCKGEKTLHLVFQLGSFDFKALHIHPDLVELFLGVIPLQIFFVHLLQKLLHLTVDLLQWYSFDSVAIEPLPTLPCIGLDLGLSSADFVLEDEQPVMKGHEFL